VGWAVTAGRAVTADRSASRGRPRVARFALAALAAFPAAGAAQTAPSAPSPAVRMPIAAVDMERVVESTPGFSAVRQRLEDDLAAFRRLAERLDDSVRTAADALQREASGATEARRAALEARYGALLEARATRAAGLEGWAAARRDSALAPFTTAAQRAVDDERAASGVGMLFDLAAAEPPLAVDAALDLTDRVVARVRALRITPAALAPIVAPPAAASATAPNPRAAPGRAAGSAPRAPRPGRP
jgi:Skp family chaperone for outer membrane proteins